MILLQVSTTYTDLQSLINGLYDEMIPLAEKIVTIGQGLAGIGGLIYVIYKLWPALAGNQPLDFYPLMRPFAIFFVLIFYMGFIDVANALLTPVVEGTSSLVESQNLAVAQAIKRKEELIRLQQKQPEYSRDPSKESMLRTIANKIGALNEFMMSIPERIETSARQFITFILELLFYASALIISAIRTFFLIILVIIGPLALGFSVFPGFEGTFNGWIARYIQIYLWLPIANILGSIISRFQVQMVEQDISRLVAGGSFDGSDLGYLIFLLFGIISYMTVPSVATWVVESSGAGRALQAQTRQGINAGRMASSVAGAATGTLSKGAKAMVHRVF